MGAIAQLIQRQHARLANRVCLDLAGDNAVLLSGSGRSGTSWLANLCNYQNGFRYIFEPLNPDLLAADDAVTQWCPSLDEECPMVRKMLRGEISMPWVNSRNGRLIARRRLIKEIRSNLMLPWINHHFPMVKTVLIIRNPLAVAASRKMLNSLADGSRWVWKPSLERLLAEPMLADQISNRQFTALSRQVGQGIVMETIADWCLNNLVATSNLSWQQTYPIFYEDLVSKPETSLRALFEFLDIEYRADVMVIHQRRSETSRSQPLSNDQPSDNPPQWQTILDCGEVSTATELLNLLGLDRLYSGDWQPCLQPAARD
ncbi:MAG: hypothetical protein HKN85_09335 [Gammaproteobacteria bacterium]|nr:hypothetical protein [Gammaproteobacteria bacterium]